MYVNCYDSNHSYMEFNAGEGKYNKRRRKGIYEKLLCVKCEHVIKEYEDYAKGFLYGEVKRKIRTHKKDYFTEEYDYRLFKLFVLSLLWRASLSSQDNFRQVSLGKYEEELRIILLQGLKVPVNEFPIYMFQTHINGEISDGVFMGAYSSKSKFDGKTIYQFIIDGVFFFVGVGSQSLKTFQHGSWVTPSGLKIGYDELSKLNTVVELFDKLNNEGKFSIYRD